MIPHRTFRNSHHLPIVFRSLDVEDKTKPVPLLVCPVRADVMTVGNCGRCADFREIEFSEDSLPVLRCVRRDTCGAGSKAQPKQVQEVLRVPAVCSAPDTALASVLPYLGLGTRLDAIPVLDRDARPVGFVTIGDARRLVAAGISLETKMGEIMNSALVCVLPETSLDVASRWLTDTETALLVAVAADGSFLGVVSRSDIEGDVEA